MCHEDDDNTERQPQAQPKQQAACTGDASFLMPGTGGDLFFREQRIYENARSHMEAVSSGAAYDFEEFRRLAREYGRMLKFLRRATRQSDLTTKDLHVDNLDLLDKTLYDEVTGIYNRRFLEQMLRQTMRIAARSGEALSLLMIDIDFFKNYNDTYGHGEGDNCLRAVAQALHSSVSRGNDFAARYGGEEFAIVLPGIGSDGACTVAEKTLRAVRDLGRPHSASAAADHVTISVGAVTIPAVRHAMTGEEIVKRADEALYESKRNGRNRYTHVAY